MILAFMLEIQTLAPQYSTFGTQTFKNSYNQETIPCNLGLTSNFNLKEDECIISNIAQFSNRISVSFPFFSLIFYTANWLLIVVLLISLIYSSFFKKEDIMNVLDNDDFDEKMSLREFENTI